MASNITHFENGGEPESIHDLEAAESAGLAKEWAIKTDGKVSNTDFSSKYYAQRSQESAQELASSLTEINTIKTDLNLVQQDVESAQQSISNSKLEMEENLNDIGLIKAEMEQIAENSGETLEYVEESRLVVEQKSQEVNSAKDSIDTSKLEMEQIAEEIKERGNSINLIPDALMIYSDISKELRSNTFYSDFGSANISVGGGSKDSSFRLSSERCSGGASLRKDNSNHFGVLSVNVTENVDGYVALIFPLDGESPYLNDEVVTFSIDVEASVGASLSFELVADGISIYEPITNDPRVVVTMTEEKQRIAFTYDVSAVGRLGGDARACLYLSGHDGFYDDAFRQQLPLYSPEIVGQVGNFKISRPQLNTGKNTKFTQLPQALERLIATS